MKTLLKLLSTCIVTFSLASCETQENIAKNNNERVYASRANT